ncbi:hypothetical protein WJX77_008460 [Trebouxia sp. C0004]
MWNKILSCDVQATAVDHRTSFQLLPPTLSPGLASDSPVFFEEDTVHTQTQHKKILDKGKPEGRMRNKVRLTFKPKERQIWIGSAASTQKVYYSQIKKIESHVIEGEEEYSMVAFHLNEEAVLTPLFITHRNSDSPPHRGPGSAAVRVEHRVSQDAC